MRRADRLFFGCCHDTQSNNFLCEKDWIPERTDEKSNGVSERRKIKFSEPNMSPNQNFTKTVCLSGHWTRDFLACDTKSACLQNEHFMLDSECGVKSNLNSLCQSSLSTLFQCRTGVGRVSYSLVCDHRQDCLDNSDEDFCVYPLCAGAHQFECANKQVRHTGGEEGGGGGGEGGEKAAFVSFVHNHDSQHSLLQEEENCVEYGPR